MKLTRRQALVQSALATATVMLGIRPPKTKASSGVVAGCVVILLAGAAIYGIKLFIQRCSLIYRCTWDTESQKQWARGGTANWWAEHGYLVTTGPNFSDAEACEAFCSTHPITNGPPAKLTLKSGSRTTEKLPLLTYVGNLEFDDNEPLPEVVIVQKSRDLVTWVDVETVDIPDQYTTEPVLVHTIAPTEKVEYYRIRHD